MTQEPPVQDRQGSLVSWDSSYRREAHAEVRELIQDESDRWEGVWPAAGRRGHSLEGGKGSGP